MNTPNPLLVTEREIEAVLKKLVADRYFPVATTGDKLKLIEGAKTKLIDLMVSGRRAELEETVKNLRGTYHSAVTQGLAGIMKWKIDDSIKKLEKRLAQLNTYRDGGNKLFQVGDKVGDGVAATAGENPTVVYPPTNNNKGAALGPQKEQE